MYSGCPVNGLSTGADENFPKRLNRSVMIATPLPKIQSLKTLEKGFMDDSNTKVSKKDKYVVIYRSVHPYVRF